MTTKTMVTAMDEQAPTPFGSRCTGIDQHSPDRSHADGRCRRVMMAVALCGAALTLGACGSSSSSTTTTAAPNGTSTSVMPTTSSTTASGSTTTSTTAVVTSVPCPSAGSTTVCEFYSPTKNISCEINTSNALCLTITPARSATLAADGTYMACQGETCLSNAGLGTQSLAYGTSTSNGTYTCLSLPTGMTCTATGRGFTISTSGIVSASA